MWYNIGNKWYKAKNSTEERVFDAVQHLGLWKHEAPFDDEGGIDWDGVMKGTVNVKLEADKILMEYRQYFDSITVTEKQDKAEGVITLEVVFALAGKLWTMEVAA